MPAKLIPVANRAGTDADRAFLVVISQVVSAPVLDADVEMLHAAHEDPVLGEFETMPADADEAARDDLAHRLRAHTRFLHTTYPAMRDLTHDAPVGRRRCAQAISIAIAIGTTPRRSTS